MGLAALAASFAIALLTPQQKAAMLVVSGLPAPPGAGGVFVAPSTRRLPRPRGALVFADQEGGRVRSFPDLPPARAPRAYTSASEAFRAGRATALALPGAGVDVDFAPVLDAPEGPLGSRQFRSAELGLAFARGLGNRACVKHFPGLGTAAFSTDDRPHVDAVLRSRDLAPFRAAVRAGVPCVMVNHAFYRRFGPYRALSEPGTYRLLRSLGFDGVAITDSLSLVSNPPAELWARRAVRAGADLILFTYAPDAARAIKALVPLAERGELDEHVARVFRLRTLLRG